MSGVLVLGAGGMLGRAFVSMHPSAQAVGRSELDLSDPSFELPAGEFRWVINLAAYTAVDRAESEPEVARRVNALGPERLARLARERGARVLQVSTDFVFDGRSDRPYREEDATGPLGVYGRTKREGEEAVLEADADNVVLRTAWLYGDGACFPRTMVRLAEAGRPLRVVDDQRGSPTWAPDVAGAIALILGREPPGGIYHAAGVKAMTWWELARRALATWDPSGAFEIEPVTTADFPTPAPRPAYSVLDSSRMLGMGWRPTHPDEALAAWAARLRASGGAL